MPFKRRREQKTNYKKRISLVISRQPRLVVRVSNKYIICQLINYKLDGDVTIVTFNSKKLDQYGFKPGKNLQSAYLSGFIIGLMGLKKGVKKAVLDIGLKQSIKNSRIYACLKGAVESGLNVPHGEDILPSDELLKKDSIKKVVDKIKSDIK